MKFYIFLFLHTVYCDLCIKTIHIYCDTCKHQFIEKEKGNVFVIEFNKQKCNGYLYR